MGKLNAGTLVTEVAIKATDKGVAKATKDLENLNKSIATIQKALKNNPVGELLPKNIENRLKKVNKLLALSGQKVGYTKSLKDDGTYKKGAPMSKDLFKINPVTNNRIRDTDKSGNDVTKTLKKDLSFQTRFFSAIAKLRIKDAASVENRKAIIVSASDDESNSIRRIIALLKARTSAERNAINQAYSQTNKQTKSINLLEAKAEHIRNLNAKKASKLKYNIDKKLLDTKSSEEEKYLNKAKKARKDSTTQEYIQKADIARKESTINSRKQKEEVSRLKETGTIKNNIMNAQTEDEKKAWLGALNAKDSITRQRYINQAKELKSISKKTSSNSTAKVKLNNKIEERLAKSHISKEKIELRKGLKAGTVAAKKEYIHRANIQKNIVEKTEKDIRRKTGRSMGALSFLFFGQSLQSNMIRLATVTVSSFQEITKSQTGAGRSLTALSANFEYLKFTIGNAIATALEPYIPTMINIITATADWVSQNQSLVGLGIILAGIAGFVITTAATLTLLSSGWTSLFGGMSIAAGGATALGEEIYGAGKITEEATATGKGLGKIKGINKWFTGKNGATKGAEEFSIGTKTLSEEISKLFAEDKGLGKMWKFIQDLGKNTKETKAYKSIETGAISLSAKIGKLFEADKPLGKLWKLISEGTTKLKDSKLVQDTIKGTGENLKAIPGVEKTTKFFGSLVKGSEGLNLAKLSKISKLFDWVPTVGGLLDIGLGVNKVRKGENGGYSQIGEGAGFVIPGPVGGVLGSAGLYSRVYNEKTNSKSIWSNLFDVGEAGLFGAETAGPYGALANAAGLGILKLKNSIHENMMDTSNIMKNDMAKAMANDPLTQVLNNIKVKGVEVSDSLKGSFKDIYIPELDMSLNTLSTTMSTDLPPVIDDFTEKHMKPYKTVVAETATSMDDINIHGQTMIDKSKEKIATIDKETESYKKQLEVLQKIFEYQKSSFPGTNGQSSIDYNNGVASGNTIPI